MSYDRKAMKEALQWADDGNLLRSLAATVVQTLLAVEGLIRAGQPRVAGQVAPRSPAMADRRSVPRRSGAGPLKSWRRLDLRKHCGVRMPLRGPEVDADSIVQSVERRRPVLPEDGQHAVIQHGPSLLTRFALFVVAEAETRCCLLIGKNGHHKLSKNQIPCYPYLMIKQCPLCKTRSLEVTRISCGSCNLSVEGDIHVPALARLSGEDMQLAEALVLSGGNLKRVAADIGVSYPTLRKRLDRVVTRLGQERARDEHRIETILSAIEAGTLDAEAGIRSIKEIRHEL